ncbi:membrane protein insertase, YidC/Oxa1 family, C-terminal domain-containing protein [Lachnospiraceae bacterium]|nr:membrane protein insertase, YidC/Oxa1 family, C-terminal domain-containing protein [Lachnospiraceae bacterium]
MITISIDVSNKKFVEWRTDKLNISIYLYTLLIKPLELLFEVIFYNANKVIGVPGLSIIALSLAMNFLVLPLYKRADAMQAEEREVEERLGKWVKHIKKAFKGDERFMMLQTFYRQNDYKPSYALRGSLSLLLEIPFFIAAYHFLSNLYILQGASLGPIADLGQPDGLIKIGGFSINILPILMTVINIASAMIYSKNLSLKSKIQMYGMALVFLVFLYQSPSGLAFYWTLNNIFSLLKNVFYKIKQPKKVLAVLFGIAGAALLVFVLASPAYSKRMKFFLATFAILLIMPLVLLILKPFEKADLGEKIRNAEKDNSFKRIFILSGVFLCILLGLFIPSNVIAASTAEFIDVSVIHSPIRYVVYTFFLAAGYFLVWMGIFYYLADKTGKIIFALATWCVSAIFVIDFMFFKTDLGILSSFLKYEEFSIYTKKEYLINFAAIFGVILVCAALYKWNKRIVLSLLTAGVIAMSIMSIKNIYKISTDYKEIEELGKRSQEVPTLTLSKEGQNVVVIMMDRMCGYMIPFVIEEKPELKEKFDGFTYYYNTITFGHKTNYGTPGLYGGYEYVPTENNKRDKERLVDKQNEALKVMPVTFDNAGFDVTVCDPTYAGYQWIPDLSIYDDYPNIKAYITMGRVNYSEANKDEIDDLLKRNFFCYSVFKTIPLLVQPTMYDFGNYCSLANHEALNMSGQTRDGISKATGYDPTFMNSYNVLDSMPNITEIAEGNKNTFLMMSNDMTHGPMILQEPEYMPAETVDNTKFDKEHKTRKSMDGRKLKMKRMNTVLHYHVNMCAMIKLGQWFDYLREQGVYDNTKIIIVSDHAWKLRENKKLILKVQRPYKQEKSIKEFDMLEYNCVLFVKDFNAKGFTFDDKTFMTNADVPTIAFKDVIDNPTNPFTGKAINSDYKNQDSLELIWGRVWDTEKNNGNTFVPDFWFRLSGDKNVHKKKNWEFIGYY